ncbi:MAG: CvpA family protein [Ekhidna sp.]
MSTFDIILLIALGFGAVKGYMQGFIVEIFSFVAFFVGLFLALELTVPVSLRFFGESNYFDFVAIVVFIVLFLLLSFGIKLAAKFIKNAIDVTFFGTLDNIAGAIAGVAKWAFIISIIFWVFDSVGFAISDRYGSDSFVLPYIVGIGPKVFGWLSEALPLMKDLIDSMEGLSKKKDDLLTFKI